MRHWSAAFVGLPWKEKGRTREGVDCWGLVQLVYGEQLSIALPSYCEAYACVAEREEIAALMSADSSRWPWDRQETATAREFDIALFRRAGLASHVGVVIAKGSMLHIVEQQTAIIESYSSGRWTPRLVGIYRHARAAPSNV